jgi:di/tricarboxylate transporter
MIGTGPNPVMSGMLEAASESGLSFFELTPAGLPIAVLGCIALTAPSPRLLPDRRTHQEQLASHLGLGSGQHRHPHAQPGNLFENLAKLPGPGRRSPRRFRLEEGRLRLLSSLTQASS